MILEQLTQWADPIGAVIGFILTLMVLSYIIGDNFMFRLAIHIFIGVASGYAVVLILHNVLWNQVIVPLLQFYQGAPGGVLTNLVRLLPALLLSGWMLTKASPRLIPPGNACAGFYHWYRRSDRHWRRFVRHAHSANWRHRQHPGPGDRARRAD